ncbi:MAG: hypothetical protein OXH59_20775 [Rhodospirillaceae bacterium]|nr:hypothetical protein [Rhodospirillaceae bacterium]
MTGTQTGNSGTVARPRTTWRERAFVLGGFAVAALVTPPFLALGGGADLVGAAWLAAVLWTVPSSLVLALRSGICEGDWSAFRNYELPDNSDTLDWSTKTGAYAYMRVAEEHERLMRGN